MDYGLSLQFGTRKVNRLFYWLDEPNIHHQKVIGTYIRDILFDIINDFFYASVIFYVELPLV